MINALSALAAAAKGGQQPAPGLATIEEGRISTVREDGVYAVVPTFDSALEFGPLAGQTAGATAGQPCLLGFPESDRTWLIALG